MLGEQQKVCVLELIYGEYCFVEERGGNRYKGFKKSVDYTIVLTIKCSRTSTFQSSVVPKEWPKHHIDFLFRFGMVVRMRHASLAVSSKSGLVESKRTKILSVQFESWGPNK
jgi:hypothetical protein